ncbi:MAG: hypothetical protein LBI10_12190 [Deltaproteobacteria bacterium]|jgi:hypothetical protein|nr:hypothetical protein [Deltaproteobacteria bacterium]
MAENRRFKAHNACKNDAITIKLTGKISELKNKLAASVYSIDKSAVKSLGQKTKISVIIGR